MSRSALSSTLSLPLIVDHTDGTIEMPTMIFENKPGRRDRPLVFSPRVQLYLLRLFPSAAAVRGWETLNAFGNCSSYSL